jgi:protein-S-isoprenylcysteine O-methyltransferase Ste14
MLSIKLNIEETIMLTDRRHLWPLLLALAAIAVGLVLLGQGAGLALPGEIIRLPALLLLTYGLVVAWWHTQRALAVFEVRTARAVHRALRGPLGRMR